METLSLITKRKEQASITSDNSESSNSENKRQKLRMSCMDWSTTLHANPVETPSTDQMIEEEGVQKQTPILFVSPMVPNTPSKRDPKLSFDEEPEESSLPSDQVATNVNIFPSTKPSSSSSTLIQTRSTKNRNFLRKSIAEVL
jgi:hypothetical protein